MGMFDSAAGAITKGEGLADKANGPLDLANQLLGGGPQGGAPGDAANSTLPYKDGRDLDEDIKESADAYAHNLENALNSAKTLEFVHFDYVHLSTTEFFPHTEDYSDLEKNDKVKPGDRPRAIQFRSGLEREAILLSRFMKATQEVLKERESTGSANVAAALNTLGNLLGSSGGGSGKTQSSELDSHIGKVVDAVKPVLVDSIRYKNTHKAGRDLHQARANYRALLQKVAKEEPTPDAAGGLIGGAMNKVSSGLGSVGGTFAKIVSFTQGVAFKAQDVKAKFFVLVAIQQEQQIEKACNAATLKAIAETANPFLPVWFLNRDKKGADTWEQGPGDPLSSLQGNMFAPARSFAQPTVDNERNEVKKDANAVKKFFENPPDDPPPGQEALGIAFKNPPEPEGETSLVPMQMGDVACQAFLQALGLTPPLGLPETIVSGIVGVVLEFTEAVYKSILVRDAGTKIDEEAMLGSAREDLQLGKRLEALALASFTSIQDLKNTTTPSIPGMTGFAVKPGDLVDKGVAKLDDLIAEKIKPVLDPILEYAMKSLAEDLELARIAGRANKCHTMEWYLGRLPQVQATLFCNLFFPFWNALMNAVAGLVDGATGGVLKSLVSAAASAQKSVQMVQAVAKGAHQMAEDAKAKMTAMDQAITDTQKNFAKDESVTKLPDKFTKAATDLTNAAGANAPEDDPNSAVAKAASGPPGTNPVEGRSEKGQGQKVGLSEYKEVASNHIWIGKLHAGDAPTPAPAGDGAGAKA